MQIELTLIALSALAQLVVFLKWAFRKMRDDQIYRAFVKDVATNHLPHLYHAMRQLSAAQGIEMEEPPPVRWVELNGDYKK